jgi:DNA-binding beta-propeller fold protein YncE
MKKTLFVGLVFAFLASAGVSLGQDQPAKTVQYHLKQKIVLGGDGFWDYLALDAKSRLLYVSHQDSVEIVNVDTGARLEPITSLGLVHGIVLVPEFGRGYITDGKNDRVVVFSLKTRKILGTVSTGGHPDAALYDGASRRLFSFNARGENATAIDVATDKAIGQVALGGKPEFGVADGKGKIFVNIEDKSEVAVFDARTLEVLKRFKLAPGEEPTGLAFDGKNNRLFSACDNSLLVVLNSETGAVVTTVPIGRGSDGVKFDPGARLIFSSNGEGTLTVIRQDTPDKYSVAQTVETSRGARTLTIDPTRHEVFVTTAEFAAEPKTAKDKPAHRPTPLPGTFMVLQFAEK